MPQFFIAYHGVDKERSITPIISHLRRNHQIDSVWYDEAMHAGVSFWKQTQQQIANADGVLYVAGNQENPDEHPILAEARSQQKRIAVVRIGHKRPLPDDFANLPLIDLPAGFDQPLVLAVLDAGLSKAGLLKATPASLIATASETVTDPAWRFDDNFYDLNFSSTGLFEEQQPATGATPTSIKRVSQPLNERLLPGIIAIIMAIIAVALGISMSQ